MRDPENQKGANSVGYGRPPTEHQFKKGKSGNPKGRPRGSKNKLGGSMGKFSDIIMSDANRSISVSEGGRQMPMTIMETAIKSLGLKAASGHIASSRLYLSLLKAAEQEKVSRVETTIRNALNYKRREAHYIETCKTRGLKYVIPIPHPDHIIVNYETMDLTIDGPCDQNEFNIYKAIINQMVSMEVELEKPLGPDDVSEEVKAFFAEERELTFSYLCRLKDNIPETDPLWKEFAPKFRKAWIDYYYYYGPDPHIPEERLLSPRPSNAIHSHLHIPPENRRSLEKRRIASKTFNNFMREKLASLMGDDWHLRLDRNCHKTRSIEADKIRYEYHRNVLNLDHYDYTDDEKYILENYPDIAAKHFAWE